MKKYDFKTHVKIVRIIRFNVFARTVILTFFKMALFFLPFIMCIVYFFPSGKELYAKISYTFFLDFRTLNFINKENLIFLGILISLIIFCFSLNVLAKFYISSALKKKFSKAVVSEIMRIYDFTDIEEFEGETFGYEKFMSSAKWIEWKIKTEREEENEKVSKYLKEKGLSEYVSGKEEPNEKKCWKICKKLFSDFDKVKIVLIWAMLSAIPFVVYWISEQNDYKNIYFGFAFVSSFVFLIFFIKPFVRLKINKINKILSILYPEKKFFPEWKLVKDVDEIKKEIYEKIPVSKRKQVLLLGLKKYFLEEVVQHIE